MEDSPKPVRWVGSARADLKTFLLKIRRAVGQALYAAQCGEEYPAVKALRGFSGRSVLEILALDESGAYRTVYTVRFADAIYVLHAFQKKSKIGVETPKPDLDLIARRLVAAEIDNNERRKRS